MKKKEYEFDFNYDWIIRNNREREIAEISESKKESKKKDKKAVKYRDKSKKK